MKLSSILIGVAGVAVGAGALYAYNRFIGGGARDGGVKRRRGLNPSFIFHDSADSFLYLDSECPFASLSSS